MRKLVSTAGLAAAVALCVAGTAYPASGTTIHLVEKDQAFNFVDNPPTSKRHIASIGDMFAFTSTLLTKASKRAGTANASCVVTSGGKNPVFSCTGAFDLAGGELELQAVMRANDLTTRIAIVGGTGAYEGARGSMVSHSRGESSPYSDDTVHLLG